MLYESQNLILTDDIKIERGDNFSFPAHLHGSFEFITLVSGEMQVKIDEKTYTLTRGKGVMIFPNQTHELITEGQSSHYLCIFSPDTVRAYAKQCASKLPKNNLIEIDDFYLNKLISLNTQANVSAVKGLLYSLCGELDATAEYTDRDTWDHELLQSIFNFVENSYSTQCDLGALAESTGYNYVYLSRYFKEKTGITFTEYVNRYRINQACYLLGNTDKTILNISEECGFESLRSFNRNFLAIVKSTPKKYRETLRATIPNGE